MHFCFFLKRTPSLTDMTNSLFCAFPDLFPEHLMYAFPLSRSILSAHCCTQFPWLFSRIYESSYWKECYCCFQIDKDCIHIQVFSHLLADILMHCSSNMNRYSRLMIESFLKEGKQTHYLDTFSLTAPLKFSVWRSFGLHSCLIWHSRFLLPEE